MYSTPLWTWRSNKSWLTIHMISSIIYYLTNDGRLSHTDDITWMTFRLTWGTFYTKLFWPYEFGRNNWCMLHGKDPYTSRSCSNFATIVTFSLDLLIVLQIFITPCSTLILCSWQVLRKSNKSNYKFTGHNNIVSLLWNFSSWWTCIHCTNNYCWDKSWCSMVCVQITVWGHEDLIQEAQTEGLMHLPESYLVI